MVKYEELDMEVIEFSIDDVVTTSCVLPNGCLVVANDGLTTEIVGPNA